MQALRSFYQKNAALKFKQKEQFIMLILLIFLTIAPKAVLALHMVPFGSPDEGGSTAVAAWIAGKDFRLVYSGKSYFGFGMSLLYAPFFYCFDNPYTIYRSIAFVQILLQCAVGIMCYEIVSEMIEGTNRYKYSFFCGIFCSYFSVVGLEAYNETGIVFVCIAIMFSFYKALVLKKWFWGIIGMVLAGYSVTLHARAIIVPIGIMIMSLAFWMIYKKKVFDISHYVALFISLIVCEIGIRIVKNFFWLSKKGTANASVLNSVNKAFSLNFLDYNTYKSFLILENGVINTYNMVLAGMFSITIYCCCMMFKTIILHSKKSPDSKESFIACCLFIFIFCFMAMTFGVFAEWGKTVTEGIVLNKKGLYSYKAFTYIRYGAPFLLPLMICCFIYIYNFVIPRHIIFLCLLLSITSHYYWIRSAIPYIKDSSHAFYTSFYPFSLIRSGDTINEHIWLRCSAVFLVFLSIVTIILLKNKTVCLLGLLSFFLAFQFLYSVAFDDIPAQNKRSVIPATIYEFLVENYGNEEEFPQKIACINGYPQKTQFYLNCCTISDIFPEDRDTLIYYYGRLEDEELKLFLRGKAYRFVQLGSQMYLLIGDEKEALFLEENGVRLSTISY